MLTNYKNTVTAPSSYVPVGSLTITSPLPANSFTNTTPPLSPVELALMAKPISDNDRRTPRREPVHDHLSIVNNTVAYLQNKRQWRAIETEMMLPKTPSMKKVRQADVVAWNRYDREFYIVECKAAWNDFQRDHKWLEYKDWCHYMAFAVPEELAEAARLWMEDCPVYKGIGLLVIPNDFSDRRMVRRPARRPMAKSAYWMMVEQWATSCRSRLIGARLKVVELEYKLQEARR